MLTVSGRLLKVQSRNLPAARNFSSGLRAIFMQSAPGPGAAPDLKGGPLAPFGPGLQTFRRCASPSGGDSPATDPATRKRTKRSHPFDAQPVEEEHGGGWAARRERPGGADRWARKCARLPPEVAGPRRAAWVWAAASPVLPPPCRAAAGTATV